MANSKANIYPIQLQGAELNLNKFDAEIKQYSGFNKNNSPFVGGCLSNLFIKDKVFEGANSENTYVAANGDVYHVDNEGLWKNDSKLLNVDSDNLYDIRQLDITFDVVNLFDEYAFIYKQFDYENNVFKFYFRFYDFYADTWKEEFITSYDSISDIIFMCERIHFNTKYVWTVGYKTREYVGNVCPAYNNFMLICSQKVGENNVYSKNSVTDIYQNDATYIRYAIRFAIHTLYNDYNDKVYVAIFPSSMDGYPNPHNPNPNKFCFIYSAQIQTDGTISFNLEKELTGNATGDNSYYTFIGSGFDLSKLRVYDDTQHTFMYFTFNNKLYLEYYYHFQGVQQCSFKIVKDNTTGIKIEFSEPLMCDFSNDNLINGDGISGGDKFVFFNFGMLTRGRRLDAGTPYSACDYENKFVTAESEKNYKFNVGAILNKIVLLNNETVTGLTLPKTQSILISDWNSVDENGIFTQIDGDYDYKDNLLVIFKEQDSFYKVFKTSTPKLFLKENQIVINSDIIPNSYRISDGKTLLFAPSWNNRFKGVAGTDFGNEWYIASSINEYKLENNPSILINPVKVLGRPNVSLNFYKLLLDSYENLVNFYYGKTIINYHFSAKNGDINNLCVLESLEGLPFPSDTNGNVLYSPSLFSKIFDNFGNKAFIKSGKTMYPLIIGNNNQSVMAFYMASGIDNLTLGFIIQGQFYGIFDKGLYSLQYLNGVLTDVSFIVSVENLQFCGNTPYEAYFFSPTNRCLYSFVGSNVLQQKQFVDKISEIKNYRYNPATQSVFLFTDIGLITISAFGMYLIERQWKDLFLREKGVTLINDGLLTDLQYYDGEELDKQNIELETCFYGVSNETVSVNDCLYIRLFSEEHEEGEIKISATTLANTGRKTEETTFKITSNDWDKMTHSLYLRYQPKTQRGLGVSFSINSPFKIASMSVGTQADAILIDKVSKGAINAPAIKSSNVAW